MGKQTKNKKSTPSHCIKRPKKNTVPQEVTKGLATYQPSLNRGGNRLPYLSKHFYPVILQFYSFSQVNKKIKRLCKLPDTKDEVMEPEQDGSTTFTPPILFLADNICTCQGNWITKSVLPVWMKMLGYLHDTYWN